MHEDPVTTIECALRRLLREGDVAELRVPNTRRCTVSGYYTDLRKMAQAAAHWSGKAPGVYFTLNPVNPDLLARSANRWTEYARCTTADGDILRRRRLPVDFDPKRPAGIPSTEAEHAAALERARECRAYLKSCGWPRPLLADSGNGTHLLYPVDLPNDGASREIVRACLEALALRFNDERVEVDTLTANAARIWKVYGTLSAKGDNLPERPHRIARLIE